MWSSILNPSKLIGETRRRDEEHDREILATLQGWRRWLFLLGL